MHGFQFSCIKTDEFIPLAMNFVKNPPTYMYCVYFCLQKYKFAQVYQFFKVTQAKFMLQSNYFLLWIRVGILGLKIIGDYKKDHTATQTEHILTLT